MRADRNLEKLWIYYIVHLWSNGEFLLPHHTMLRGLERECMPRCQTYFNIPLVWSVWKASSYCAEAKGLAEFIYYLIYLYSSIKINVAQVYQILLKSMASLEVSLIQTLKVMCKSSRRWILLTLKLWVNLGLPVSIVSFKQETPLVIWYVFKMFI